VGEGRDPRGERGGVNDGSTTKVCLLVLLLNFLSKISCSDAEDQEPYLPLLRTG
jgi:hypothetical protein